MLDKHRTIIEDSIKDNFEFREKYSDWEISSNFQLSLAQLDLFKTIASLVIGIAAFGYISIGTKNLSFLIISIILATITLIFTVSYTREVIDLHSRQNKLTREKIIKNTDETINMGMKALKEDDANLYFEYIQNKLKDKFSEPELNYIGEIIIFSFYLSLGFLMLSFFISSNCIWLVVGLALLLVCLVYIISFKDWMLDFSSFISKKIKS